jgi:hypothetical protein
MALFQILRQHVDDAARLWLNRDRAVEEPHYRSDDLARLDGQLDAHLDGLRVAEAASPGAAWELCREELRWQEPGEVFAAAILALESADVEDLGSVSIWPRHRTSFHGRWFLHWDGCRKSWHGSTFCGSWASTTRDCAASGSRRPPWLAATPAPCWWNRSMTKTKCFRARSLRAVGELGRLDLLPAVREHLEDDDARCRYAAAWSVALLSPDDAAVRVLRRIAAEGKERSLAALQLALRRTVAAEARAWLLEFADQGAVRCGRRSSASGYWASWI